MRPDDVMKALRAANPLPREVAAALPLQAAEAEMLRQIVAEPPIDSATRPAVGSLKLRRRRGARRLAIGAVITACVALGLVAVLPSGGHDAVDVGPAQAFAAPLVRFADSTPRLLLALPGWRVTFIEQPGGGAGEMHFIRGGHTESTVFAGEKILLDHFVQLNWAPVTRKLEQVFRAHDGNTGGDAGLPEVPLLADLPGGIGLPTSGMTSVDIPTGLGVPVKWLYYEGRSEHWMDVTTYTFYDHLILRLRVTVANMADLRALLGGLRQVNADTWLRAMPASVIKSVASRAAIKEMLEGLPLPAGFDASKIPGVHDTQTRYYLGTDLTGAVACSWFKEWDHARTTGDRTAERRAVAAMSTASKWPLFRWMSRQGAWPQVLVGVADQMAHDNWHGESPAQVVNGDLGCAQLGVKLGR